MEPRVLVDTSIIIDLFGNVAQAEPELRRYTDRAISIVTWMELVVGLRDSEKEMMEIVEANFTLLPLTQAVAEETVFVRRSTKLKLADAIILATAHVDKRTLLTRNTRDFTPGRFVRIPYKL